MVPARAPGALKGASPAPRQLAEELARSRAHLHLHLDFDGTLVPLADDPGACWLDADLRHTLKRLAGQPRVAVAIISGRSLADLIPRVALESIAYAGNHGLELRCGDWHWQHPGAQASRPLLQRLARQIRRRIGTIPGAVVEDKRLGLSLHTRQVAPPWRRPLRRRLQALRPSLEGCPGLRLSGGHEVLEIRPALAWSKAEAVGWLMRRQGPSSGSMHLLFAGDDRSDEDVFRAWPRACTIRIGGGAGAMASAARWRLTGPDDLRTLLEELRDRLQA